MSRIVVKRIKVDHPQFYVDSCPFQGITTDSEGYLSINDRCRLCKLCLKFGPELFFFGEEISGHYANQTQAKNIAVFLEWQNGRIHPVSWELVCKAKEMVNSLQQKVFGIIIGAELDQYWDEFSEFPLDEVVVFDSEEFRDFRIEPYTAALLNFVQSHTPNVLLIGATALGRSLAPRVAIACRTGLTADCTGLELLPSGALIQTRPAFGGNIMAQIKTPYGRPQMATVRPHVMNSKRVKNCSSPKISKADLSEVPLVSGIKVLESRMKPPAQDISAADVVIAVGRGIKKPEDLVMIQELAQRLSAVIAFSRPLVEAGWSDSRFQIGLSGRSIHPKLLITVGVSGAVQFSAGIQGAEFIIAINSDPEAPIMNLAHLGFIGDCYEIIPRVSYLLETIAKERQQ
jgi:electron transfer flavoprotein alpha subunit